MTSFFPFRLAWAALAGGVLLALLWQPRAAIPEAPAETAQWRLPEVRPVSRNASIPAQIAGMAWWGGAREEAEKAEPAEASQQGRSDLGEGSGRQGPKLEVSVSLR